jgi:hypothetical protein
MISSKQYWPPTSRPTVRFWQIVTGWKDRKGNFHTTSVEVRTNEKTAWRRFNVLELPENPREDRKRAKFSWVRLYEVETRTAYSKLLEYSAQLVDERRF